MADNRLAVIRDRTHKVLQTRSDQLTYNMLAIKGGRPYIDARLHRAANESDRSWFGDGVCPGRRQRSYNINSAGRVAQKINQYLFAEDADRDGVDVQWAKNVTKTGMSIRQFWELASEMLTGGQWVWLQTDRGAPAIDPSTGKAIMRTAADRERAGDRICWSLWGSTEVVDWSFDSNGRLTWLITEQSIYDNTDPYVVASEAVCRKLWIHGGDNGRCQWISYKVEAEKCSEIGKGALSIPEIPFVLLGNPDETPWWFDDVEMIQQAILNLESLDNENLVQTVFPQLILPASAVENITQAVIETTAASDGKAVAFLVKEIVRGLSHPFVESAEDRGTTRFLTPNAGDLKIIQEKVARLKADMFDQVGLALFNRESRQVASAEAKQFDHLDTESTLCNRALLMQEAEIRLIDLSKRLDTSFATYSPIWPQAFDVETTSEDVTALVQLGNFAELTPKMRKQVQRTAVALLDEIESIPAEAKAEILAEIDTYEPPTVPPFADIDGDDDDDDGDDDGDTGEPTADAIGKVPLAVQQLALARERASKAGDTEMADAIGAKMKRLLETIA